MTLPINPRLSLSQKNELLAVITTEAGGYVLPSQGDFGLSFQLPNSDNVHSFDGRENIIKYAEGLGVDLLELDAKKTALGGLDAIQNAYATYETIQQSIRQSPISVAGFVDLPNTIARNMKNAGLSTSLIGSQKDVWDELLKLPSVHTQLESELRNRKDGSTPTGEAAKAILDVFKAVNIESFSTVNNKRLERSQLLLGKEKTPNAYDVDKDKLTSAFQTILNRTLDNNKGRDYLVHQIHAFCYQHNVSLMIDSSAKYKTPPGYMSPDVITRLNEIYAQQSRQRTETAFQNIDITGKLSPIGVSAISETFDDSIREHLRDQVSYIRNIFLSKLSNSNASPSDVSTYKNWLQRATQIIKDSFAYPTANIGRSISGLNLMTKFLSPTLFSESTKEGEMSLFEPREKETNREIAQQNDTTIALTLASDRIALAKETFYEIVNEFSEQCPSICEQLKETFESVYPLNASLVGVNPDSQIEVLKETMGVIISQADSGISQQVKIELNEISKLNIQDISPPWPSVFQHLNNELKGQEETPTSFKDTLRKHLTHRSYLEVINEFKENVLPLYQKPLSEELTSKTTKPSLERPEAPSDKPESEEEPKQQAQTAAPKPQAQTAAPKPQAQTAAPKPQAQTAAPKPQAQTAAPKPQAQTAAPKQQAQTAAPKPQAQTAAPKQQAQTAAPKQQAQTAAPKQQAQTAASKQQVQEQDDIVTEHNVVDALPTKEADAALKVDIDDRESQTIYQRCLSLLEGDTSLEKIDSLEERLTELFFDKNDEVSLPDQMDWFVKRHKEISDHYADLPNETRLEKLFASFEKLFFANNKKAIKGWYNESAEKRLTAEKVEKVAGTLFESSKSPVALANAVTNGVFDEKGFIPEWLPHATLNEALTKLSKFNLLWSMESPDNRGEHIDNCDTFLNDISVLKKEWENTFSSNPEKQSVILNLWHRALGKCDFSDPRSLSSTLKFIKEFATDENVRKGALEMSFDEVPELSDFEDFERNYADTLFNNTIKGEPLKPLSEPPVENSQENNLKLSM